MLSFIEYITEKRTWVPRKFVTMKKIEITKDLPKDTLGVYKPRSRSIKINPLHPSNRSWKDVEQTLRHEIAHNIDHSIKGGKYEVQSLKNEKMPRKGSDILGHHARFWHVLDRIKSTQKPYFPSKLEGRKLKYLNKNRPAWKDMENVGKAAAWNQQDDWDKLTK